MYIELHKQRNETQNKFAEAHSCTYFNKIHVARTLAGVTENSIVYQNVKFKCIRPCYSRSP